MPVRPNIQPVAGFPTWANTSLNLGSSLSEDGSRPKNIAGMTPIASLRTCVALILRHSCQISMNSSLLLMHLLVAVERLDVVDLPPVVGQIPVLVHANISE